MRVSREGTHGDVAGAAGAGEFGCDFRWRMDWLVELSVLGGPELESGQGADATQHLKWPLWAAGASWESP